MKKIVTFFAILGLIIGVSKVVYATSIIYATSNLGGESWEYTYSVTNNTLLSDIEEFTIFFDYGLFDNLTVTTPLADWDEFAVNPDLIFGVPDDGFYDALAMVSGIAPGATKTDFSVSFDWLGSGSPGAQSFEIVDSTTFDILDSGKTAPASAPVPEPSTLLLLASGLIGLNLFSKKRKTLDI